MGFVIGEQVTITLRDESLADVAEWMIHNTAPPRQPRFIGVLVAVAAEGIYVRDMKEGLTTRLFPWASVQFVDQETP